MTHLSDQLRRERTAITAVHPHNQDRVVLSPVCGAPPSNISGLSISSSLRCPPSFRTTNDYRDNTNTTTTAITTTKGGQKGDVAKQLSPRGGGRKRARCHSDETGKHGCHEKRGSYNWHKAAIYAIANRKSRDMPLENVMPVNRSPVAHTQTTSLDFSGYLDGDSCQLDDETTTNSCSPEAKTVMNGCISTPSHPPLHRHVTGTSPRHANSKACHRKLGLSFSNSPQQRRQGVAAYRTAHAALQPPKSGRKTDNRWDAGVKRSRPRSLSWPQSAVVRDTNNAVLAKVRSWCHTSTCLPPSSSTPSLNFVLSS
jgi:hypothetical protein